MLSVLLVPSVAYANMGLPMIAIMYPAMGILLVPVIVLEVLVLRRLLSTPVRRTWAMVTVSNLVSTGVGIPLTWVALVAIQFVTGGTGWSPVLDVPILGTLLSVTWLAPWMMPSGADEHWMIPLASLALLVPFFFASWLIEYVVSLMFMRDMEAGLLKRAVFVANLVSYALLVSVALVGLGMGIYKWLGI
jgi:hypothetical protein